MPELPEVETTVRGLAKVLAGRRIAKGDKVVVYLHAWVRMKESNEWVGGRFADGFAFRDGKIVEYRTFAERAEARAWAGIEDREAN